MYLIASILMTSAMLITLKYIGIKDLNPWITLAINYTLCFVLCLVILYIGNHDTLFLIPSLVHIIIGVLFVIGFYINQRALNSYSLQQMTLFYRLSLVIPIAVSILFLGNPLKTIQIPGLLIAVAAMYFLTIQKGEKVKVQFTISALILFLVWLFAGMIDTGFLLIAQENLSPLPQIASINAIFVISALFTVIVSAVDAPRKPSRGEWQIGGLMGLANVAATYFFITGLGTFGDDATFITLNHCGIILMASIYGYLMFKEKTTPRMWIGTALAVTAIIWLIFTN